MSHMYMYRSQWSGCNMPDYSVRGPRFSDVMIVVFPLDSVSIRFFSPQYLELKILTPLHSARLDSWGCKSHSVTSCTDLRSQRFLASMGELYLFYR